MEPTVDILADIIEREGADYLHDEPYEVYCELMLSDCCSKQIAGGILLVLLNEIQYYNESIVDDTSAFAKCIQEECGLNSQVAESVAGILSSLYLKDNMKRPPRMNAKRGFTV
ncbi:hypothetical protein [uncultured Ruminobacter sp.]|uniref:hypothetical protein n=1 Tax=uncultured Ruminobacter sp. TaxID=538947 RepID=UPI0025DB3AB7|nr:hypothetical protein [uncultured Ruminobacter sp.]